VPTRGVKEGRPLSPLYVHYINDIDSIAEGVEGVITGSSTIRVTHMLYEPPQTVHLCFLKGVLGVKRTMPNWAVL